VYHRHNPYYPQADAPPGHDPFFDRKTPLNEGETGCDQGHRTVEDMLYGLDPEPIHIADEQLRPHYGFRRTKFTFAQGYGFKCPVCNEVMHDGHRGARALRAHLEAGGIGGCMGRPAKDRSQKDAKLESFRS